MKKWNVTNIPDMTEKVVVVTGSNNGLGFEASKMLARNNARVIMTGRNKQKLADAKSAIQEEQSNAQIETRELDMADLASIKKFSEAMCQHFDHIDILINNAGVMAPPRGETKDGFELQFGTNHLGHFALTAQLFPLLKNTAGSRVVTVSSIAAQNGTINFDDLMFKQNYKRWKAYQQSKLANLMFAKELHERLVQKGCKTISIAAHPGVSQTNLFYSTRPNVILRGMGTLLMPLITQPADKGVLPLLYAATSPDAEPGSFYGPDSKNEWKGYPAKAFVTEAAKDSHIREKLWKKSEALTGVNFNIN